MLPEAVILLLFRSLVPMNPKELCLGKPARVWLPHGMSVEEVSQGGREMRCPRERGPDSRVWRASCGVDRAPSPDGRELRRTPSPPRSSVETKPSFPNALLHHGPGKATRISESPMRHKSKAVNWLVMNHICRNWGLLEVKRSQFSDSCHIAK